MLSIKARRDYEKFMEEKLAEFFARGGKIQYIPQGKRALEGVSVWTKSSDK